MKCILMNKNTEILIGEFDSALKTFSNIEEIKNINYAPYPIYKTYLSNNNNDTLKSVLADWFLNRGIPSWRDKLDILLYRLNISAPSELLDKAFGLSLSDQYWIKPCDSNITYDEINFFNNDFDYSEFLEASLSLNSGKIKNDNSLKAPNNTTDGMLKKAWIIEDGVRYLLKSGYKNEVLQPFNEVLASNICDRLGFNHVLYTLDKYKDSVVSKCPCFINENTELITAHQLTYKEDVDYESYVRLLENLEIENARIKLENMYILDYLILNEDRHLNNFGVIRDVNTLKILDVAPIFDNGQSLNITDYDSSSMIINGNGRLFYEILPFDEIIKIVRDINRIDLSKLDGIVQWYDDLLHSYQDITKMSDNMINNVCILLNKQINKLKKLQIEMNI